MVNTLEQPSSSMTHEPVVCGMEKCPRRELSLQW
jgi:hypothetical protein